MGLKGKKGFSSKQVQIEVDQGSLNAGTIEYNKHERYRVFLQKFKRLSAESI